MRATAGSLSRDYNLRLCSAALCRWISRPFPWAKTSPPFHPCNPRPRRSICMHLLPRQLRQVHWGLVPQWDQQGLQRRRRCSWFWFISTKPMSLYLFPPLVPDPTLCFFLVSLFSNPPLPPNCADKQPGAMAAEEVTCGILSGVLFASAGHLSFSEAEGMGLNMVPLSASHLCCDWNHINFLSQFFHVVLMINMGLPSIKSVSINLVLLVVGKKEIWLLICFCLYSESVFNQ